MKLKPNSEALDLLIRVNLAAEDYASAEKAYNQYSRHRDKATKCYAIGIFTYTARYNRAKSLVNQVMADYDAYYDLCGSYLIQSLGSYYYYNGSSENALAYLQPYYEENPQDIRNLELLISSHFAASQKASASFYSAFYENLYTAEKERLEI